jgi:hypothetical protein
MQILQFLLILKSICTFLIKYLWRLTISFLRAFKRVYSCPAKLSWCEIDIKKNRTKLPIQNPHKNSPKSSKKPTCQATTVFLSLRHHYNPIFCKGQFLTFALKCSVFDIEWIRITYRAFRKSGKENAAEETDNVEPLNSASQRQTGNNHQNWHDNPYVIKGENG